MKPRLISSAAEPALGALADALAGGAAVLAVLAAWLLSSSAPPAAGLRPAAAALLLASGCAALGLSVGYWRRRTQAAAGLRAREDWLALAGEAVGVGTFEWDLTSQRIVWSPELAKIYGLAPGEFDGRYESWRELVHPDDRGATVPELALDREEWKQEFRIVRPDGSVRWLLVRARLERDARGRPDRLIGINLDVTERRQAESALQASSTLLTAALEAFPGTEFAWDVKGDELVRRERGLRSLLSPSAKLAEVIQRIHPQDRARFERTLRATLDTGARYQNRFRATASDGSLRWIEEWGALERDRTGDALRLVGVSFDVTEREAVASALRDSEERLRLTAEAAAIGTFAVDFEAGVIRYSPEACRLLGIPAESGELALGEPAGFVHPDDHETLQRTYRRALDPDGDRQLRGEVRILRDGEIRWLSFRGRVEFRDGASAPAPARALGAMHDVTEQKRIELALRESEQQRRLAFTANRVGTFVADLASGNVSVSPELRALLELPPDSAQTTADLKALIHPDDLSELRRRFAAAIAGDGDGRVSVDIRVGPRPRWLAFDARTEFREEAGARKPIRVSGVGIDVSERKRAELQLRDGEKLLRAFVNNSAAIAWMKDEHGRYIFLSENFQRRLPGAEGALGKTDRELWPPEIAEEHAQSDRVVLEEELSREGIERMPAADGGESWWRTAKFPFRTPEGGRYVGGLAVDISAQRLAEEQLREADRRKDRFLATLAHELRSPLAPLLNAVALLEQKHLPESELRYCRDVIGRQVEQITRLLDDLLDISRITLGKVSLRRAPLELKTVIERAVEMVRPLAAARGHTLEVALPPEPIWLDADLTRLVQVFANLLSNSVRYTPQGGQIQLDAERAGNVVRARVRDNGVGIAAEDLPRIFEMFGTAELGQVRSQDGLGIGLALGRGLVELHGGKLTGHSEGSGRGAEFRVELPILAKQPSAQAMASRPLETPRAPHQRRVLVADDLPDSAESMAIVLQLAGHQVATAYDGARAVELARELKPEVIVLDIGMPRLDGYEACRAIRALPGGDRFLLIALTGWGQPDDRRQAREAGFDHHLTKPVDPARLRELIASHPGSGE